MNNPTTFYIVRHAKSEANKSKIISGQMDFDIAEEGVAEAQLRAQELRSIPFAAAFASDLLRAHKTAQIIAAEHTIAVMATKMLRERNYGQIEGNSYDHLEEKLQRALDAYNTMADEERFHHKIVPDMESDGELIMRFITFLRETALAYPGKTVLLVAHGNIMRELLVHVGFGTHRELGHGTIRNTGYYVVTSDGVEFKLLKTVGIEKKIV